MLVRKCIVVLEPVDVLVYDFSEDLVEHSGHMSHFEVEELKNKNELFAHSVNNKFVVRSEHLLEGVQMLF